MNNEAFYEIIITKLTNENEIQNNFFHFSQDKRELTYKKFYELCIEACEQENNIIFCAIQVMYMTGYNVSILENKVFNFNNNNIDENDIR